MSLIVRTAGEEKTKSDIVRDYNYLIRTWEQIRLDSLKSGAPALIYEEGNLIKRALRDMFTKEISEIIIDGNNAYQAARSFMKILSPHSMKSSSPANRTTFRCSSVFRSKDSWTSCTTPTCSWNRAAIW